jgi:hypothetical protein
MLDVSKSIPVSSNSIPGRFHCAIWIVGIDRHATQEVLIKNLTIEAELPPDLPA